MAQNEVYTIENRMGWVGHIGIFTEQHILWSGVLESVGAKWKFPSRTTTRPKSRSVKTICPSPRRRPSSREVRTMGPSISSDPVTWEGRSPLAPRQERNRYHAVQRNYNPEEYKHWLISSQSNIYSRNYQVKSVMRAKKQCHVFLTEGNAYWRRIWLRKLITKEATTKVRNAWFVSCIYCIFLKAPMSY